MTIKAIGAQPQTIQHPVQRSGEDVTSGEVQSGDVRAVPNAEEAAGGGRDGARSSTERRPGSSLEQALTELDRSVRLKLQEAVGKTGYDVQADEEIRSIAQDLREQLSREGRGAADADGQGQGLPADSVLQTLDMFTSKLRVTLESLLPAVPWEAQLPPEPKQDDGGVPTVGPQGLDTFA